MGYLKFNDQNNVEEFSSSVPSDITGWYEIPEEYHHLSHFKLIDGIVIPLTEDERLQKEKDTFKKSFQKDLKMQVSRILTDTDWLVQRHTEELNSNSQSTTLNVEEFQSLLEYRANLRAMTNQDLYPEQYVFPNNTLAEKYRTVSMADLDILKTIIS